MRKLFGTLVALAILGMLTVSPAAVSAKHIIHLEVTIAPGTTYQDYQDLNRGEILSCAWTTDQTVVFFLKDPDGETIRHSNGTSGQAIVEVTISGNYTFNWQNAGNEPASLVFDKGFLYGEQPSMFWVIALSILIALIAVMLALIAYLSIKNMRKK